ncbi:hypothetical protein BOX17_15775 [Halomonas aestuarii]|uniref:DUF6647 domain-containing protein n=1 Tax=Halomonas aestuarii TaxID=1897729 RepID=A0A1J0VJU3_9GAMM|nr:DUF6647 family protein [Halomonas aestuarii]APE32287.1 hypothetical protein BOX17_15775 [Halomonas aestuarii]
MAIWLLALLLALPVAPVVSSSSGDDMAAALARIVREQSAWLGARTAYEEPDLPGIRFESQAALQHRCFPAFPDRLDVRVRGAYDPAEGNIYLDLDFDLGSPVGRSYLLHELVHHFQVHNREHIDARDRGRLEGQAYRLQLRWLEEAGVDDPWGALGIDEKTLRIIERSTR